MSIFLVTFLSCSDVVGIANRIQQVVGLTYQQKIAIVNELRKVVPSCPVIISPEKGKN
jgi:hypothetical protein